MVNLAIELIIIINSKRQYNIHVFYMIVQCSDCRSLVFGMRSCITTLRSGLIICGKISALLFIITAPIC